MNRKNSNQRFNPTLTTSTNPMLNSKKTYCFLPALLALATVFFIPQVARAIPSFARQSGLSCTACHTEFPILTPLGREFKLGGYTMSTGQSDFAPLAVMLQPSFTQTNKSQPGGAAPHFAPNSNFALTQASIFYGGRLFGPYAERLFGSSAGAFLNKIGIFGQVTYDGIAGRFNWDNMEIRYADTGTIAGHPITYGIYANNNPGLQDLWNTTPAWGFPFSSSGLGPTPAASTLIEGGLAQQVAGLGAYAMLSHSTYLDIAGYHTLDTRFQEAMGISPGGETQVPGIAPYWRIAYTTAAGNHSFEVGLFGLLAGTYPGRVNTAGEDHITDFGMDSQYQVSLGKHDVTGLFSVIHEWEDWHASLPLGNTSNKSDGLWSLRATIDYLYDKTYGGAIGYFLINGDRDALLYPDSPNGSPASDGLTLQVNWLPFNKSGGPSFWPKSNVKFSVQYVIYTRFNGTSSHASDNNTLYLESWIAF
jgi:hypothetical protein